MKPRPSRNPNIFPLGSMLVLFACAGLAFFPTGCARRPSFQTLLPRSDAPSSEFRAAFEETPGSLPSLDEEIWVIHRTPSVMAAKADDIPGMGELRVAQNGERAIVPLRHTAVRASLDGYLASVDVTQQFTNPYGSKIEAVYTFPLPENAAVTGFVMTLGERKIRAIIRERAEAEAIYRDARDQGYRASLLVQDRPNIFTQSVANIEPGKEIEVNIRYFHTLAYRDGEFEFAFPMIVGPRYLPPGETSGIRATSAGHAASPPQGRGVRSVAYLPEGVRSGHDIHLTVDVHAGVDLERVECSTHRVHVEKVSSQRCRVSLDSEDSIPNKDFVLRYRVAAAQPKSGVVTYREGDSGYFALMLYPPADLAALSRRPMEMVFLVDSSGSMGGEPLEQAKAAVSHALDRMLPGDTFQIIHFASSAEFMTRKPIAITPESVQRGKRFLAQLTSSGGTLMMEGIRSALDHQVESNRGRFVCFLTDGYIGNDPEILALVREKIGASRIFSFGVGSSPNRYLLNAIAKLGRGAVAYLGLHDDAGAVMDPFMDRISHPALTDVEVDWGEMETKDVFPRTIPDLFVGRPVVLAGRFSGHGQAMIRLKGKVGGKTMAIPMTVDLDAQHEGAEMLPKVWARAQIASWVDDAGRRSDFSVKERVQQLALRQGLMSAYTAFVAVDTSRITPGEEGTTVPVVLPVPQGAKYSTTR